MKSFVRAPNSHRADTSLLARFLVVRVRSGDAANDAREAGASIAKLLEAARDDRRRASAAMQWIVDNVPS